MITPTALANTIAHAITDMVHDNQERNELKRALKNEIQRVKEERCRARQLHEQYVIETHHHLESIQKRMKVIREKEIPVHRYASYLRDEMVPSYIVVLQAQLCQKVHHMCAETAQLKLAQQTLSHLQQMAKLQTDTQLDRLSFVVEAKVEFQLQHDENVKFSIEDKKRRNSLHETNTHDDEDEEESWEKVDAHECASSPAIDSLVQELAKLQQKESPEADDGDEQELTLDDLQKSPKRTSVKGLDQLLNEGRKAWTAFHESWSSNCDNNDTFLTNTKWNSEKHVRVDGQDCSITPS